MFAILSGAWETQKEEEEGREKGERGKSRREGGSEREGEGLIHLERTLNTGMEK